jgi:hypothetical protein
MKRILSAGLATWLVTGVAVSLAQQAPAQPAPYAVGNPLGLPAIPSASDPTAFKPISSNVKVFGAIYSTESCSYDAERGLIVAPARGVGQAIRANDAFVALINHDGSVHTARWIGVQNPGAQRDAMKTPLVLNEPYGSLIHDGVLYLADRDGGIPDADVPGEMTPSVAVIRKFNMADGTPAGEIRVEGSAGFNDLGIAEDGTLYATNSGMGGRDPQPDTWQVWRIAPDGTAEIFKQGEPLFQPNGIEVDPEGNIVVVNIGSADVLTFSPSGELLNTEQAAQSGNDGLVILDDGTKYVSSVIMGGISKMAPGQPAELIAENIPSAASMCYDSGANQLVIPMNAHNGLAFLALD